MSAIGLHSLKTAGVELDSVRAKEVRQDRGGAEPGDYFTFIF
jgi:hypothetical protein